MNGLPAELVESIRDGLEQTRAAIYAQLGALAGQDEILARARVSADERPRSAGDADMMSVERDVLAKIGDSQRDSLRELEEALERIAAGTYGLCATCGKPIPPARLEARPRTTTCVPCATRR